ncbi:MAG: 4'-phosphopantetheinyl transferase superfamily protein [Planctomycetota bacterium]
MSSTEILTTSEINEVLDLQNPIDSPIVLPACVVSRLHQLNHQSVTGCKKRKREFEAGRFCASQCLESLGVFEVVEKAEDRSPVWPNGTIGSISHSDCWVWSVAAEKNELGSIGIDTEAVADAITLKHLQPEIMLEGEMELGQQIGLTEPEVFTVTFSAKESFYKCIYPLKPLYFGFQDVRVVRFGRSELELSITQGCPNRYLANRSLIVSYVIEDNDVFTACWLNDLKVV